LCEVADGRLRALGRETGLTAGSSLYIRSRRSSGYLRECDPARRMPGRQWRHPPLPCLGASGHTQPDVHDRRNWVSVVYRLRDGPSRLLERGRETVHNGRPVPSRACDGGPDPAQPPVGL